VTGSLFQISFAMARTSSPALGISSSRPRSYMVSISRTVLQPDFSRSRTTVSVLRFHHPCPNRSFLLSFWCCTRESARSTPPACGSFPARPPLWFCQGGPFFLLGLSARESCSHSPASERRLVWLWYPSLAAAATDLLWSLSASITFS
jgi:hypothetical protein